MCLYLPNLQTNRKVVSAINYYYFVDLPTFFEHMSIENETCMNIIVMHGSGYLVPGARYSLLCAFAS